MAKFRATISWVYHAENIDNCYGTDDPLEMALIDMGNDPVEFLNCFLDHDLDFRIEEAK